MKLLDVLQLRLHALHQALEVAQSPNRNVLLQVVCCSVNALVLWVNQWVTELMYFFFLRPSAGYMWPGWVLG